MEQPYTTFRNTVNSHATLSEAEWADLSMVLSHRTLHKNEVLLAEGEVCDKIWFISKGLIRYYQLDSDQNERTTCFAMETNFIASFSSYLTGNPTYEILVAVEETEVVEIRKSDFLFFVESVPGINALYRQVLEEAFLLMETLNYTLQHHTALERYQKLVLEGAPELLRRVPLVYLASYLGMSPETLSRVRARI